MKHQVKVWAVFHNGNIRIESIDRINQGCQVWIMNNRYQTVEQTIKPIVITWHTKKKSKGGKDD